MTCLCLTRNRRQWLPQAIRCYQNQTYQNRELLILADGDDVRDLVPADERIRLIHFDGALEIGEKRNFGCAAANGDVIAHWDDDDVSAPERLADQLKRLRESGAAVTGYHSMLFTNGSSWLRYIGSPDYAVGTSLLYRKDWWMNNRFASLQIGEDNDFVYRARDARKLAVSDAGDLMFATIHGGNTSIREFEGKLCWQPSPAPDMRAFGVQ